jgi:hypothetical protein
MELFESGLKNWVSIRQTGLYLSNESAGEEPIIFHQPPNNVLEWSASIESGILHGEKRAFSNVIRIHIGKTFVVQINKKRRRI